ncbi:MAG TPA: hypothetical protein VKP64_05905 [Mycobacteriales bacterium]|nr:hypothetical protein [Mycobacteriales bacterium]
MTTSTVTRLAALPRVNLLPPEIEEQGRFRRFQAGLGAAAAVTVGVVGLLYVNASGSVTEAQQGLDAAQAKTATVNAETSRYAHVPEVYAQVAASEAMLTQAMGKEVRWSYYLNDLSLSLPGRVWLTQLQITQNVDAAASSGGQSASGSGDNRSPPPESHRSRSGAPHAATTTWRPGWRRWPSSGGTRTRRSPRRRSGTSTRPRSSTSRRR